MPRNSVESPGFRADVADCRRLLRGGSRSFYAASFLLPRWAREPASALYAFCRLADDAVDLGGKRADAIHVLEDRLASLYRGDPRPFAADRALAVVVRRFGIPMELPAALLEGLAWDAAGRRYRDLDELYAYAARVAGAVGAMMSIIMGARSRHALARACDLGVAMQLTNIARDIGEDARAGRIYLPLDWLEESGVDAEGFVREPRYCPALASLTERLLGAADVLYLRADAGVAHLASSCRPGIRAARRLYAAIGDEVLARGGDGISSRAVVGAGRKSALLARALLCPEHSRDDDAPPLSQTRFLVEAAMRSCPETREGMLSASASEGRAAWVIDLFTRLERRGPGQRATPT